MLKGIIVISIIILILSHIMKRESVAQANQTKEAETNRSDYVRPKSNCEITNAYFNMHMDIYLRKKYKNMLSWEYVTNAGLHFAKQFIYVNIHLRDGQIMKECISVRDVWDSTSKPQASQSDTSKKKDDSSPEPIPNEPNEQPPSPAPTLRDLATQWLADHGAAIEEKVQEKIGEGKGFFLYYEVESKYLETKGLMEEIVALMLENTSYDVSWDNNHLIINFQSLID